MGADQVQGQRLRPLPNRQSTFQLALANRSGKARQVEVTLLAVPALGFFIGHLLAEGGDGGRQCQQCAENGRPVH